MIKALILHSGGLDSSTCLLLAQEQGREILSLGIDYGQRSKIELVYADRLCNKLGIARRIVRVEWDKPTRRVPRGRSVTEIRKHVSPAFLPGRNMIFLSLGVAEAKGIGADEVWIGVNCIDYSGYPDCTEAFIGSFRSMLEYAIPNGPEIVAPLIRLSKPEIAKEAARLGLLRQETWSCYCPVESERGYSPCGKCDACTLNKYAWSQKRTD
jgi:7-cyano-7-deazaguanine synthase